MTGDPSRMRIHVIEQDGLFVNINKPTLSKKCYKEVTILKKFKSKPYLESKTMTFNTFTQVVQFVGYVKNKDKIFDQLKKNQQKS